ncbi:MAG: glycosyltransferase family 10 domain-containing protein [Limisphaerales bacterium]
MYIGFYNFYQQYNRNRMITDASSPIGDDVLYPMVKLCQFLQQQGHKVATLDMDAPEKFDAAVFFDHPTFLNPYLRKLRKMKDKKLYLILCENEANRPDNYWPRNHRDFDKVFTWNPQLVDNKKYFQCYYNVRVPENFRIDRSERKKFCVTIASQKYLPHRMELYTDRVGAVRWFERHHPDEFDLYGQLWDRRYFTGQLSRLNLLLIEPLYKRLGNPFKSPNFPSWRGAVPKKREVMQQYKFALVIENAVFPGYVSEKILDAFFAGCVPVYLGAPDVTDFIPAETFIDRRNFKNWEEAYAYMKGMPEKEYTQYLDAIENFVRGPAIKPFSAEGFIELVQKQIVEPNAKR